MTDTGGRTRGGVAPLPAPAGGPPGGKFRRLAIIAVVLIAGFLGLTIISGSWYTVNETERGVILRNGALQGTAQPGLGFKLPLIDTVVKISVQSHVETYDQMEAYSSDQQPADLRISVNYRIPSDNVDDVYARFGSREQMLARVITPAVLQQTKIVFGGFTALKAIQERGRLNTEMENAVRGAADPVIQIESVQLEDIKFSQAYETSIEQRMLAEVEVQRIRQNAEREKVSAEITVTQARARADAVRQAAQAESEAIRLRGDAEAAAIKARGDALRENPNLIGLTQAERWDGKLPTTMLPGSAVPMLNLQPR